MRRVLRREPPRPYCEIEPSVPLVVRAEGIRIHTEPRSQHPLLSESTPPLRVANPHFSRSLREAMLRCESLIRLHPRFEDPWRARTTMNPAPAPSPRRSRTL